MAPLFEYKSMSGGDLYGNQLTMPSVVKARLVGTGF